MEIIRADGNTASAIFGAPTATFIMILAQLTAVCFTVEITGGASKSDTMIYSIVKYDLYT